MSTESKIVKQSGLWVHWLAALGVFFMCDAVGIVQGMRQITESASQIVVWNLAGQGKGK